MRLTFGCSCAKSLGRRASVTVNKPEEKPLRTASFIVHATRGVIRDAKARRRTMLVVLALAMMLLVGGSTFLQAPLSPHDHPFGFLLFWMACGWLTLTALLLAIFDLLVVKLESRRAERTMRENLKQRMPGSAIDE